MLPDGSKTRVEIPFDDINNATEYVSSKDWIKNEFGYFIQTVNIVYVQKP